MVPAARQRLASSDSTAPETPAVRQPSWQHVTVTTPASHVTPLFDSFRPRSHLRSMRSPLPTRTITTTIGTLHAIVHRGAPTPPRLCPTEPLASDDSYLDLRMSKLNLRNRSFRNTKPLRRGHSHPYVPLLAVVGIYHSSFRPGQAIEDDTSL